MILPTKILCASLNYLRLDNKSIENLKSASINSDSKFLEEFKVSLGLEIDSIAVIKKCNSVVLLVFYQEELSLEYVRSRLLKTWDLKSEGGIIDFIRDIRFYEDIEALRYLAECASGIHSVTTGDSQVLSQIIDNLSQGLNDEKNILKFLIEWLRDVVYDSKMKTEIFKGNTSLERIACELVLENISNETQTLLIGYGKSGKLISKILNCENYLPMTIVNRSFIDIKSEGLDVSNVLYNQIDHFSVKKNIKNIVIALESNPETEKVVKGILKKIINIEDTKIIDLSTPPFLDQSWKNYVDIRHLSEIANCNLGARKNEVNKVKEIVSKKLDVFNETLNKNMARIYITNQKKVNFDRLDQEKLNLIKERSQICKFIRHYLDSLEFLEVTTPYIVGISTDPPKVDTGGTIGVDWVGGTTAFLRQSNQIYKQILVASGLSKIYEIGPFWRKESNESYRHLQESIGLDVEISQPENLEYLFFLATEIIKKANDEITSKFGLSSSLVIPNQENIPVLTYREAVKLLHENGTPVLMGDDLGLVSEANLGKIIKNKFNSDILIIKNYPDTIKKFYTKNIEGGLTETFDIIVGGWELVSGAIRQTDGELIKKSMSFSGINANNYLFYISIIDKAVDHGGFCIGLDRLVAKILSKEIISDATPFPRTFKRLIP